MQDFKHNVKKHRQSILFFSILIGLLFASSWLVVQLIEARDDLVMGRNKAIVNLKKEPKNSIDVLVVGDSLSYTSVSPLQLWEEQGITAFVCGQPGQKIKETYDLLKTALEYQTPKLVILETNVLHRPQTGMEAAKDSVLEKANTYFPIFQFHDIWKPILMGKRNTKENYKGYELRNSVKSYRKGEYMKETQDKKKMPAIVESYANDIVTMCKKKGIEVLLLSTPSPKNYTYQKHNAILDFAREHALEYLNLNFKVAELGIDWKVDSLDKGDHLNMTGAFKVTQYMGEFLKAHYELKNHQQEPGYQQWNQEMQRYKGKVTQMMKSR